MISNVIKDEKSRGVNLELSDQSNKFITIEHSYIDFQRLILNEKLQMNKEEEGASKSKQKVFGQLYFARLMVQNDENNIEFYTQDMVQKFIDLQFNETQKFFFTNLIIYLLFFFVPFLLALFVNSPHYIRKWSLFSCLWTQIYFLFWEILQLWQLKKAYLKKIENLMELLQIFIFMIIFVRAHAVHMMKDLPIWE